MDIAEGAGNGACRRRVTLGADRWSRTTVITRAARPNLVTRSGLEQIETRVRELESAATQESDEARLGELKRDLRYWRTRLATAQLAPPPADDQVGIGSQVRFRLKGALRVMRIVGDDEADPSRGLISFSSPLGRALMGLETGDLADFAAEADAIEIVSIDGA